MTDSDDEWDTGFDDEAEDCSLQDSQMQDRFAADVSTVDAQDTLDVSAQFFRVCARVYMDNPLHNPVYRWISSLPRTGNGNIKAISDHLVLALRLYVDTLNSGSILRLGLADVRQTDFGRQPLHGGIADGEQPLQGGRPHEAGYSSSIGTPSRRYQQSRRFKDTLPVHGVTRSEGEVPPLQVSPVDSGMPSRSSPSEKVSAVKTGATSLSNHHPSPLSATLVQAHSVSSPPIPPKEPPPTPEDGLSYVARLAREGEGW